MMGRGTVRNMLKLIPKISEKFVHLVRFTHIVSNFGQTSTYRSKHVHRSRINQL